MVADGAVVHVPISGFPEVGAPMIVRGMKMTSIYALESMVIRSCGSERMRRPWQERHGHEDEH